MQSTLTVHMLKLALLFTFVLATHQAQANAWQSYGKYEANYTYMSSQTHIGTASARLMAAKGELQLHLQARFQHANTSLQPIPASQFQITSLAVDEQKPQQQSLAAIDRLNYAIYTDQATWIIGRQAISLGQSYFFNPLALGSAASVPSLDAEYQRGIDAVSGDIWLDNGNLQLVMALGNDQDSDGANWRGSALLARYTSQWLGNELALQAGKIYGAYQFGAGISGDTNGVSYRLEAATTKPLSDMQLGDSFTNWVAGLGYQANDNLHMEVEYLHNGAANHASFAITRYLKGLSLSTNKAVAAASISYQFVPLVQGQWTEFYALTDDSQLGILALSYNASDNATLALSWQLTQGISNSQYGQLPETVALTFRDYF